MLIRHTFSVKADSDDTHLCDPRLHNIKKVIVNIAEEVKDIIEKVVNEAYSQLKTHLLIFWLVRVGCPELVVTER